MEYWSIGVMDRLAPAPPAPLLQHSNTPILHYPITPSPRLSPPQSRFPLAALSGNVHAWRSIHSELFCTG